MAYNIQSTIWSFITSYKRVTNQQLHYLELIQDKATLTSILDSVRHFEDAGLQKNIRELQRLMDKGDIQFSKSKKPKKKKEPKSNNNTDSPIPTDESNQAHFYKEYAIFSKTSFRNRRHYYCSP